MALRFGKNIFYHVPKCGGSYVRKIIQSIEPDIQEFFWTHSTPLETKACHAEKYFTFTVVRHPVKWYESYFRYRHSGMKPWVENCYFDQAVRASTYEQFIENVLNTTLAGATTYAGHLFTPYLEVDAIIHLENIHDELGPLLKGLGYEYKPMPPVKVSPKSIPVDLRWEYRKRLEILERGIAQRLGYETS